MKKNTNFWLLMFLAISLALPIYSIADMTLTLRTEDGFSVTTNTPTIKSFAVDNDKNLIVILKDPPILDFGNPYPQITIENPSTCTILDNANVKANPRTTFSFTVRTTPGATLSADTAHQGTSIVPDNYGATFVASGDTGIFSWNTAGTTAGATSIASAPSGRYLAVFTSTPSSCPLLPTNTCTSQLVVVINISQQYKLTLTAGANGTVSPAGDSYYDPGTQVQISATASSGYYFSGWSDGETGNPKTVTMNQDRTISANFTQTPPTYTVETSVVNPAGGSVSPTSRTGVSYGSTTTFTVTTNAGYTPSPSEGSLSGTTWTTAPVTSSHTVTVTFTINTYTVNASVVNSAGGSVSPTSRTVNYGETATFTVTTNSGYTPSVSEGTLPGTTGTVTWTIPNVTSTHTATVTFTQQQSGEILPWTLTNYTVAGVPGLKKTFIINIPPGKTYGSVTICSLDPSTSFTYKFTPIPGYLYLGRSEITGSIYYGILELPFSASYFTPRTTDGYVPTGDSILELNFISTGRILISTSIY